MTEEKSFTNRWLTTAERLTVALVGLFLLACSTGCASSGTLQPHHAFRQATTPYQGYYQGQQPSYAIGGGLGSPVSGDYAGYGGYNISPPSYGQSNTTTANYGAYGNPFASPYSPPGNLNVGQFQTQGGYQPQYNGTGYNYQPAYAGGFTSGSC